MVSRCQRELERGELRQPTATTLREAAETWLERAESGEIRARGGKRYKPSVTRSYRKSLEGHVLPLLRDRKLSEIRKADVKRLVEQMQGEGKAGSTIRNAIAPLRVILGDAVERDELAANPCANLRLPAAKDAVTASPPPKKRRGC